MCNPQTQERPACCRMLVQHDSSLADSALCTAILQQQAEHGRARAALFASGAVAQPGPGILRDGGPRYDNQ